MRLLYRLIWFFATALAYPILGTLALLGSAKWRNRLGFGFKNPFGADYSKNYSKDYSEESFSLWAHASSVGEVKALSVLLKAALKENSKLRSLVSVMTENGAATATLIFAGEIERQRVAVRFIPVDSSLAIFPALRSFRPNLFIFTETEIWPNWISRLQRLSIPICLINGRISERTFSRYHVLKSALAPTLASYSQIMAQTDVDAQRFMALGAKPDCVTVTGNLKSEAPLSIPNGEQRQRLRARLGVADDSFLLVAGSVRPGEEVGLIDAFCQVKSVFPQLRLALAPRHTENLADTKRAVEKTAIEKSAVDESGLSWRLYSEIKTDKERSDSRGFDKQSVILIDTFGVLTELYGVSDCAFVGGTMVPVGGHNILEPPQSGAPVLFGPNTSNVTEAVAFVVENNLGRCVNDWAEFQSALSGLISGEISFNKMSAESAVSKSGTALAKTLKVLGPLIQASRGGAPFFSGANGSFG